MNIKSALILATTALAVLSASVPASARTSGNAGWASAFPYVTGGHVDHPDRVVTPAPRYRALQR